MDLTHFNKDGRAKMVNVGDKMITCRKALAMAKVRMKPETLNKITNGMVKKGDVFSVAQVAGIMGAKKTSEIIPMCHPLILSGIDLSFEIDKQKSEVIIYGTVSCSGQTGVEMEALNSVTIAALTIYDMCKAIDKEMVINEICLLEKIGGKSGLYKRGEKDE